MSPDDRYRRYAEEVALHLEQAGLSRTVGRIFGWLLICDPPHQTMDDIVDGLQVSKSSVSTATRQLIQVGLVQRLSLPGERRDYYRVVEDVWRTIMRERASQITAFRELAEQGLALLDDQPAERRRRLQGMRDFYAFFEREMPALLERWEAEQQAD
ncbi:MAG TPA: MarR family transcriptional regulator [Candidatus Sulfomarinibacteraceae bacterium]|nr:MarR family transcriptional regulator [Candidatus Sulfomarinibacteraceae bacterium]